MSNKTASTMMTYQGIEVPKGPSLWDRLELYLDAVRAGQRAQTEYEAHVRDSVPPAEAAARVMSRVY